MIISKALSFAAVSAVLSCPGWAQEFPERAVTLVLPVAAGSGSDTFGRIVADELSKQWGQPVVVENMPGAGALLGTGNVVNSDPDGYRLMFTSNNFATSAAVLKEAQFDVVTDLQEVAVVATAPMLIVAGKQHAGKDLTLILAESSQREVFYGATGQGSPGQFLLEMLNQSSGSKTVPVFYSSGPDAFVDLAAERLDLYGSSLATLLPAIDLGAVPVALIGAERSPLLPDVPTIAEVGYADALLVPWYGFYAPTGTPEAALEKLHADIGVAMQAPAVVDYMASNQFVPMTLSIAEAEAYVAEQMLLLRGIAEQGGMIGG